MVGGAGEVAVARRPRRWRASGCTIVAALDFVEQFQCEVARCEGATDLQSLDCRGGSLDEVRLIERQLDGDIVLHDVRGSCRQAMTGARG